MSCSSNMVYCLIIISIWALNHPRFSTKMSSSEKTPLIKTLTLNPVSLVASGRVTIFVQILIYFE